VRQKVTATFHRSKNSTDKAPSSSLPWQRPYLRARTRLAEHSRSLNRCGLVRSTTIRNRPDCVCVLVAALRRTSPDIGRAAETERRDRPLIETCAVLDYVRHVGGRDGSGVKLLLVGTVCIPRRVDGGARRYVVNLRPAGYLTKCCEDAEDG
jgi:hypothetical protein